VSEPLRVGVVGCGLIAERYVKASAAFTHWRPVACADLDTARASSFASDHDLRTLAVDELIGDPGIDLVLNLTPPIAHARVVGATLASGKHAYTEKPLAATVEGARELVVAAEKAGLRLGCAPDTFLGSAYEAGRRLIQDGAIGRPLGAAATMLTSGPELWHPNAEMFYVAGGGPLLDIAPYYLTAIVSLLGPVASVAAFTSMPSRARVLGAGPRAGKSITVTVPTHITAVLQLAAGALVTLTVGFESLGQYVSGLTVYGSEGSLILPDANGFGGEVVLRRGGDEPVPVNYALRGSQETRGLGLDELGEALQTGRAHLASGSLALHVLEAAEAIGRAAERRRTIDLAQGPEYASS
jgi:predicted dehydrogenase